jgi:hypothetical protein
MLYRSFIKLIFQQKTNKNRKLCTVVKVFRNVRKRHSGAELHDLSQHFSTVEEFLNEINEVRNVSDECTANLRGNAATYY